MPLDYEERAGIAQARCMGYSFFADVFNTEVTREFIANMGSFEAEEGSKLQEFVALLGGADLDEVTQDVRSEFCALFLNMSAHPVFTSESVYLSGTHTIMQEPRNQVLAEYRSRGLAVDKDSFDWPEDHVSMEMLFMSHLCKQESDLCRQALEAGECTSNDADLAGVCDAQKKFFGEHLDKWMPMFVEQLSQNAKTLFYKGIAEYLDAFLEKEREMLSAE